MFYLYPVNKAPLEDDDIIAGYQKMSLKCLVSIVFLLLPLVWADYPRS